LAVLALDVVLDAGLTVPGELEELAVGGKW
jgi:hypothetical protein